MTYIRDRFKMTRDELHVKGPDGNAYMYPHPNALMMFDPKSRNAKNNAERVERPGGIFVFPDHRSDDFAYLCFLDRLSIRLTGRFPKNVDEATGYTYGNAVRGNFFGLRHVAGLPMTPATYTLISNAYRRQQEGLVDKPVEDWHRNLMVAWWLYAIEGITPVDLSVPQGTSSCAPEFTQRVGRKMEIARDAFRNARSAGMMMLEGDFETPWREYQIGGCVYIVYRLQVTDKVTYNEKTRSYEAKGRSVATLEYALSSGREGELITSDKTKYVNELFDEKGYRLKGFFSCRKRTAAGGPWGLNASIGPIADAMRANIYRKAGKSYHDRTREQKTKDVHEFDYVIMADVSDHDLLWPEYNLHHMIEAFKMCGFADWWIALFHRSMTLPQYVSSLSSEQGSLLMGEWDKHNPFSMLLSGNKFTDIAGTGGMTPIYAIVQIEHTARHHIRNLQTVDQAVLWLGRYLNHELDIAQKSKSDDAAMLFRTAPVVAKARLLQEKLVHVDKGEGMHKDFVCSPYMKVGYEAGGAYLGDLLYFDHTLQLKNARFIGNIMSFVHNKFAPEYSCAPRGTHVTQLSRYKRKFPGLAWESAIEVYGDCPIFGEVLQIIEEEWLLAFNNSFRGYMDSLLKEDKKAILEYSDFTIKQQKLGIQAVEATQLSAIDREVLADPSKIHYKFKPEQISTHLHHLLFNKIDAAEITPYFNSIVNPKEKQCDLHTLRKLLKMQE